MPSRLAVITFLDEDGSPVYPGHALPGGGHPSHGLPHPPHIGGGPIYLPVFPFDPSIDNTLPTQPGHPDNTLPGGGHVSGQPIVPGRRFVVKWIACVGLALVPDNSLPSTAEPK